MVQENLSWCSSGLVSLQRLVLAEGSMYPIEVGASIKLQRDCCSSQRLVLM